MRTFTLQRRRRGLVVYQLLLILIAVALLIGLLLYLSKRAPAAETVATGSALEARTGGPCGASGASFES